MESHVSRCGASRKQIAYADLISVPAMKVPSLGEYVICNAAGDDVSWKSEKLIKPRDNFCSSTKICHSPRCDHQQLLGMCEKSD